MEGQGQGQEERKDRKDSSKRQRTEPEGDEGEAQQQQQPKEGQEQASSTSSTPSSSAAASVSSSSGQAGASNSSVSDYGFRWDRFCEFASGLPDGVKSVTGSTQARGFSDEPVTADLIAAGLRLLKALAPPSSAGNDDDDGEGEQEGEGDGDSKELAPLVVELGQWAVDSAESQKRTREVRIPGGDVGDGRSGVEATVYRASAKAAGKEAGKTEDQKDRFELTHLTGIEGGEYLIVIDKVERRFVFVGIEGEHPHCGTNDFIYDNSDGSGPESLDESGSPPTPENLIKSARKRLVEFCQDQFH